MKNRVEIINLSDLHTTHSTSDHIIKVNITKSDDSSTMITTSSDDPWRGSPYSATLSAEINHHNTDETDKAQVFYVNSKKSKQESTSSEANHSYIPVDFDEQLEKLKNKEHKERERQHGAAEKRRAKEEKRLQKIEEKKKKLEEKLRKKAEKKQQKQQTQGKVQQSKEELKEQKQAVKQQQKEEKEALIQQLVAEKEQKKQAKTGTKQPEQDQNQLIPPSTQPKTKTEPEQKQDTHALEDEDLIKVLQITDELLGHLPDDIIDEFTQSEDFKLYEKVMNKYKPK